MKVVCFLFTLSLFSTDILANTSESERSGKSLALNFEGGTRSSNILESAGSISLFLGPSTLSILRLSSLQSDTEAEEKKEPAGLHTRTKGQAASLSIRQFIGNSFFLELGVDHSVAEGELKVSDNALGAGRDGKFKLGEYTRTSGMFQIGNAWQWENFTLGVAWLGCLSPFSEELKFTSSVSEYEGIKGVKMFKDYASGPQATFMRLAMGFAF